MNKRHVLAKLLIRAGLALCLAALLPAAAAALTDAEARRATDKLLAGLEQKAAELRKLDAEQPGKGAGRIADDLEARLRLLKGARIKSGTTLFSDAAAYVNFGNTVRVTPNFFDDSLYDDTARQAILLHEAVHLDQALWERKLKFWSSSVEADAYKEEYKWLVVLGNTGYETFNVLEALRDDYGVIRSDDDTAGLQRDAGLTPELLALLSGAGGEAAVVHEGRNHENSFYAFQVPGDWSVTFESPGDTKQRYVYLIKEVKRVSLADGSVGAAFGVNLTLGEVIGADYADPGVERLRDEEMEKDRKWDFSGGKDKRSFSTVGRTISGRAAAGYRKVVSEPNGADPPTVMVTEKFYFKKDRTYYYTDFSYREEFLKAVDGGYRMFLDSLAVK